jgi:1-acyl-sn-glycerol-3-phosphate acyltransferase
MMEMGTFVAILLGEVLGAALASLPRGGLVTSLTLVFIAVLGYLTSRGVPDSPAADPDLRINWNPLTETWRNLRFAKANRTVWLSLMGISWFWFFGATLLAQFPAYARVVLGGDESVFILLLTVFSLGIGAGSLLCDRLSNHRVEIGLVPFGSLGLTLFGIDLFLASPAHGLALTGMRFTAFLATAAHWRLLADIALVGLSGGIYIVPLYALIQTRSEPSHQSRTIAANNILNALFMVVSAIVSMLLFRAGCTIPQLFLATALFNALVAVYILSLVPEFLARFLSWLLVHTLFRLRMERVEHIPEQGADMLVSNHVSYVDVLVILAASPRPIRFVLNQRFFRMPLLGFLLRRIRAIAVGPEERMAKAWEEIDRTLAQGELVAIFPEGQLTEDGELGPFQEALMNILVQTKVPIVPIGLGGLWGSPFSSRARTGLAGALQARISLRVGSPLLAGSVAGTLRREILALI